MVKGIAALDRKLMVTIPAKVEAATKRAMEEGADELVDMMKRLVSVSADGSHGNAPGTLRDSIGWTWGDAPTGSFTILKATGGAEYSGLRLTIFAGSKDAFYARWNEFGTEKMSAQPFFFPSYRAMRKRIKSRITREMKKAIRSESAE
jgi:HK97 gp10 family phage protein